MTDRPIRVACLCDRAGWCFESRALQIQKHAPPHLHIDVLHIGYSSIEHEIVWPLYDVVFCMWPQKTSEVRAILDNLGLKTPLIAAYNSGTHRPGYGLEMTAAADYVIVNNWGSWAHAMAKSFGRFKGCHISNGVDMGFYCVKRPIAERPNRVLWITSETKAQDPDDVKGWRTLLRPLEPMLREKGIECDFRVVKPEEEMTAERMVDWYNSGSVFLVTSKSEGTPNTALEAAACGCVIVSTPVGNLTELIQPGRNGAIFERGGDADVLKAFEGIEAALANREAWSAAMRESLIGGEWEWSRRSRFYHAVFKGVHARYAVDFEDSSRNSVIGMPPFTYLTADLEQIDGSAPPF